METIGPIPFLFALWLGLAFLLEAVFHVAALPVIIILVSLMIVMIASLVWLERKSPKTLGRVEESRTAHPCGRASARSVRRCATNGANRNPLSRARHLDRCSSGLACCIRGKPLGWRRRPWIPKEPCGSKFSRTLSRCRSGTRRTLCFQTRVRSAVVVYLNYHGTIFHRCPPTIQSFRALIRSAIDADRRRLLDCQPSRTIFQSGYSDLR